MPRPSLPSSMKNLYTYSVVLTQTTEEDLYKHFEKDCEKCLEYYKNYVKELDALVNYVFHNNEYKVYSDKYWRKQSPERKYKNGIVILKSRDERDQDIHKSKIDKEFRSTFEIWRDLMMCDEEFEWSKKYKWVETMLYEVQKCRTDNITLTQELNAYDTRNYETAKREYQERDKEYIEYNKKRQAHQSHRPKSYYIELFKKDKDAERFYDGIIPNDEDTCEFCIFEKQQKQPEPEPEPEPVKQPQMKPISIPRQHYCEVCKVQCRSQTEYDNHITTRKHLKQKGEIKEKTFHCELCNYTANLKQHYDTHCKSKRHQEKVSTTTLQVCELSMLHDDSASSF